MIDLKTASRVTGIKRRTLAAACWRGLLRACKRRIDSGHFHGLAYFVTREDLSEYESRHGGVNVKVRHEYARRVLAGESPRSIAHDQSIKVRSVYRALNREGVRFDNQGEMVA